MTAAIAQQLVGIPWREGGREFGRGGGTDCLGIVLAYLALSGRPHEDPWEEFAADWNPETCGDLGERMPQSWEPVGERELADCDVGVTEFGGHMAIYVGDGLVLQAVAEAGSVLVPVGARKTKLLRWYRRCE